MVIWLTFTLVRISEHDGKNEISWQRKFSWKKWGLLCFLNTLHVLFPGATWFKISSIPLNYFASPCILFNVWEMSGFTYAHIGTYDQRIVPSCAHSSQFTSLNYPLAKFYNSYYNSYTNLPIYFAHSRLTVW